jgi:hypothetical protein
MRGFLTRPEALGFFIFVAIKSLISDQKGLFCGACRNEPSSGNIGVSSQGCFLYFFTGPTGIRAALALPAAGSNSY